MKTVDFSGTIAACDLKTKIADMFIYGKNLHNLLHINRYADLHETWYVALRTLAHYSLLTLFKR